MRKKIICFFISMTFLLNLTVTTFANDTKKTFQDALQKTSITLNEQLGTLAKNSKLNTVLKNNISKPKEIDFAFNLKGGTDSFYEDELEKLEVKANIQYDLAAFKFSGKFQFKDLTSNVVEKFEIFSSPGIFGYGDGDDAFYYYAGETYNFKEYTSNVDLEKLNQLSERIEAIVVKNIDKGEFISNGNNNYTLKLSTQIINSTIEEIAKELKNDKEFIKNFKNYYYASYSDAEIIEEIDYIVANLMDENLKITYDIGINDNGLINKQRIKIFNENGYSITLFGELAGEEYLIDKMTTKITVSEPGYKNETLFETSGGTISENGIKKFNANVFLKDYYVDGTVYDAIKFSYLLDENAKKDNFTFSFSGEHRNSDMKISIKDLVGSLNTDVNTGNVSYVIENGKIDKLFDYENIIFDMSLRIKGISSDLIKLPANAIKVE